MEDQRRTILQRVAGGEITPDEGAALLDALSNSSTAVATTAPPGPAASRLKVTRALGSVIVEGDPSVREAVAYGRHSARREGSTLVIEGDEETGEYAFIWAGRRHIRFGRDDVQPLRVRVNPTLPVEVEAQAGTLRVMNMQAPIKANVQAGSARLENFDGPIELDVQAGSVRGQGRLAGGASRIRCEAGSIRLDLKPGSSVRIGAKMSLGRVQVEGAVQQSSNSWVVGSGDGTLDIEATMGSVRVDVKG
jgi:hypothetical protein